MRRTLLSILVFLPLAACTGGDAAVGDVEVVHSDSAGIAIVESRGPDRLLDWRFEEALRLGGADEGPEAFFRPHVATDARGLIYVLDRGNHRIVVFDSAGEHVRTLGSEGGGPGELQMPAQLAVLPDGTVGVQDYGKGAVVVWDSMGEVAPQIRPNSPMLWQLEALPDGFVGEYATMSGFGEARDSTSYSLARVGGEGTDTTSFVTVRVAPGKPLDLGCVQISSMPPLFQADLRWAAAGEQLVVATGYGYELQLREPDGTMVGLIRRDVQPQPATAELAAQEVGDSMRVGFGGGRECAAPPEVVVEGRGYGDLIPAVRHLIGAPDGGFLVGRGVGKREDWTYDLFDSDGVYVGTLPETAPRPSAFLPDGRFIVIEKDEYDLEYVVVYQLQMD